MTGKGGDNLAKGKPKAKPVHVTPVGPDWQVKVEGNQRATKITKTKEKAVKVGRKLAQERETEFVSHGKDGKIQSKESYGNDPCPPKDTR